MIYGAKPPDHTFIFPNGVAYGHCTDLSDGLWWAWYKWRLVRSDGMETEVEFTVHVNDTKESIRPRVARFMMDSRWWEHKRAEQKGEIEPPKPTIEDSKDDTGTGTGIVGESPDDLA